MSNWQSSSSYSYIDDLAAPEIAWEYLRRNEDYRRDYAKCRQTTSPSAALVEHASLQWGLRYPR